MVLKMAERRFLPQLISPETAAEMVNVDGEQIYKWMAAGLLPFVDMPHKGECRLPLHGLLSHIPELYEMTSGAQSLMVGAEAQQA